MPHEPSDAATFPPPADLEIGDTAGLEAYATGFRQVLKVRFAPQLTLEVEASLACRAKAYARRRVFGFWSLVFPAGVFPVGVGTTTSPPRYDAIGAD